MTKRHFIAIAATFKKQVDRARDLGDTTSFSTIHDCIVDMSVVFQQDNPRFDRVQFMRACGLDIR